METCRNQRGAPADVYARRRLPGGHVDIGHFCFKHLVTEGCAGGAVIEALDWL